MESKFRLVVIGIIESDEGKILVGKKRSDSNKKLAGKWHFIGGDALPKELPKEAIEREVLEETILLLKSIRIMGLSTRIKGWLNPPEYICTIWFYCRPKKDFIAKASSDLEEVKWIEKKEVLSTIDYTVAEQVPASVIELLRN